MKSIAKNSSFILILFTLAITCVKDKNESGIESDYKTIEETQALMIWKKFNSTSEKLLAITATNLKSLSALRGKTPNVDEKDSLSFIYVQSNNQYLELKARLAHENSAFEKDVVNYNPQNEIRYRTFRNEFLSDILDLNTNIEDLLEEIDNNLPQQ
jgi:hypothetical protein